MLTVKAEEPVVEVVFSVFVILLGGKPASVLPDTTSTVLSFLYTVEVKSALTVRL